VKGIRSAAVAVGVTVMSGLLAGCGSLTAPPPVCTAGGRSGLGLLAQAVPTASFVPCVSALAQGWRAAALDVGDGHASFDLVSDRSPRPVRVELIRSCDVAGATETSARADAVRTVIRLRSVDPRYAGVLFDVFPGGCVRYTFDFRRGPHIALMEEFEAGVRLVARSQLAADVERRLGVRLDP
jgi:hypothetical protein